MPSYHSGIYLLLAAIFGCAWEGDPPVAPPIALSYATQGFSVLGDVLRETQARPGYSKEKCAEFEKMIDLAHELREWCSPEKRNKEPFNALKKKWEGVPIHDNKYEYGRQILFAHRNFMKDVEQEQDKKRNKN
jgi:hypothetical protein